MKLKLFIATLTFGVITFFVSSSCQKKTDCKLIITTNNSFGNVVSGATVKLFANVKTSSGATVTADLKAEGVSDGVVILLRIDVETNFVIGTDISD